MEEPTPDSPPKTTPKHIHPPSRRHMAGCPRCELRGNIFEAKQDAHKPPTLPVGSIVGLALMPGQYRVLRLHQDHMDVCLLSNSSLIFRALYSEVLTS